MRSRTGWRPGRTPIVSPTRLKQAAIQSGMITLRTSGITKILAGVTTPEEILRVTMAD
jgi:type II secretory ATPase GspE/PulE/Tfp pilus assembly ATPase PilB-like protein